MCGVYHFWMDGHQVPAKKTSQEIENPWNIKVGEYFVIIILVALRLSDSIIILEPQNKPKFKWMDMVMSNHPSFSNPKDLGNRNHPIDWNRQPFSVVYIFGSQNFGVPGVNDATPRFLPKGRSFEEAFGRLFHIRVFPDNPRSGDFGTDRRFFGGGGFG